MNCNEYSIHESATGNLLATITVDDRTAHAIESVSSESPEGHFRAGEIEEVGAAVQNEQRTVYAILL